MKPITRMLVLAMAALPALADNGTAEERQRLQRAEAVLTASLEAPDKGIPKDALEKAECVGVFPDVKKGAFIVGAQGGSGVFTCRDAKGVMGAPAFFKIGGGSVGWQFGGQETDLVLLVMNEGGMNHLLKDQVLETASRLYLVARTIHNCDKNRPPYQQILLCCSFEQISANTLR